MISDQHKYVLCTLSCELCYSTTVREVAITRLLIRVQQSSANKSELCFIID